MRSPLTFLSKGTSVDKPEIVTSPFVRILGYEKKLKTSKPKHALLSYLSQPVLDMLHGGNSVRFSNDGLATSWPNVLNQLGYSVDIINWDDDSFQFNKTYDLVISHGGINYEYLAKQFGPKTKYIYFSTGSYWKYHNEQEKMRFDEFKKRHGKELPNDRRIDYPEEEANQRADAIICLGNQAAANTYKDFDAVYSLPIGSFTTTGHVKTPDEIEAGRKQILFIAGAGNIHKGLDLVLDALAELPDMHLHVYTFLDDDFAEFYKTQLTSTQVTVHNFEAFPNENFLKVTSQCNVSVMPSCSEGSPGSVVESMIQGLIPIVSKEAHIDIDNFGVLLADNSVDTIKQTLFSLSREETKKLTSRSQSASATALNRHSQQVYEASLFSILQRIGG